MTLYTKMTMLEYNGILATFIWSILWKILFSKKVFIFDNSNNFFQWLLLYRNYNEKKSVFKIINIALIRSWKDKKLLGVQVGRFKMEIAILAWRVTRNYAHSPFKAKIIIHTWEQHFFFNLSLYSSDPPFFKGVHFRLTRILFRSVLPVEAVSVRDLLLLNHAPSSQTLSAQIETNKKHSGMRSTLILF